MNSNYKFNTFLWTQILKPILNRKKLPTNVLPRIETFMSRLWNGKKCRNLCKSTVEYSFDNHFWFASHEDKAMIFTYLTPSHLKRMESSQNAWVQSDLFLQVDPKFTLKLFEMRQKFKLFQIETINQYQRGIWCKQTSCENCQRNTVGYLAKTFLESLLSHTFKIETETIINLLKPWLRNWIILANWNHNQFKPAQRGLLIGWSVLNLVGFSWLRWLSSWATVPSGSYSLHVQF